MFSGSRRAVEFPTAGTTDRGTPRDMPNIKSAKKRMELSMVARERNRARRSRIRTAIKRVLGSEEAEQAEQRLQEATALLDRASRKRLLHPNTAGRIKSRLARHVQGLRPTT